MNIDKLIANRYIKLVLAWGIIPLAYLSWCFSTISYLSDIYLYLSGITGMITACLYMLLKRNVHHDSMLRQLVRLDISVVIIGILFEFVIGKDYAAGNRWIINIATAVWVLIALKGIADYKRNNSTAGYNPISFFKKHIYLIILMLIVLLLSLDSNMYQFKWDGLLYYKAVKEAHLDSISSVALYGHIAMSSGGIYRFFASLAGDVCYGMIMANIVILELAVCAFYGIIRYLFPDRNGVECTLATSCFAFSPFLLGMVNYFSTDWFSVCIAVILAYFVIKKEWIWGVVCGCIFCMTKEPALIAYTGLCGGLLLTDMVSENGVIKGLSKSLKTVHYYFMLIPYLLWILAYKILGQWSAGGGGFGVDLQYMLNKLKVFLVFDFNWMIVLGIAISCIIIIRNKMIGGCTEWLLPLICSNLCLLIFNLLFITVNHARYIDSFISIGLLLLLLLMMAVISKHQLRCVLFVVISVVSVVACYISIDPISALAFKSSDVGKVTLLSTGRLPFGDSAIYNKQILWMEKPLAEAIGDSIQEDTEIVIPVTYGSIYAYDGMSEKISMTETVDKDIQYWDEARKSRVPFVSEHIDDSRPFVIYHVADGISVDEIDCENNHISVIYIKGINEYKISDDYELVESKDYSYRGWIITRDVYCHI